MTDDLRQRYAEAIRSVLDKPNGMAYRSTLPDALLAVRDEEMADLRERLREAADALRAVGKAALVVKPNLDKPFPDAPSTTPWVQFMDAPARRAYNLGHQIRAWLMRGGQAGHRG